MAASEARYTRVVQAAGANAEARRSAAQGLALVFTDQNRTDVGALVTTATGDVLVELLAWRAERDFVKGDPVALGSALSDYRRLGDLAQNDARAASWMYRLACCLKRTGKLTEATAAFRLLIDRFPASPCAAPATWQLDDMGKEAK
jgi:TolA-binding protein